MAIETRFTPQLIAEYTEKGYWTDVTEGERLDKIIATCPERTAILDSHQRISYADFGRFVNRLALGLHRLGLRKGNRVVTQLPNRAEAAAIHFALAKIGAIICPVVPYYRAAEVSYILARTAADAYILPDTFGGFNYLEMLEEIRPSAPGLHHIIVVGDKLPPGAVSFTSLVSDVPASSPDEDYSNKLVELRPGANDPVALMFTSGTTSAPKAIIWTHNTLHHSVTYNAGWQFTGKDKVLCLPPVFHTFGLLITHVTLAETGSTLVWMDAYDPEEAMRLVEREKVTMVIAVPAQVMSMINHPNFKEYDLRSLRAFYTAGAAMPAEIIRKLRGEVGCGFITGWGLTETICGSISRIDDPPELAATTVGRAAAPYIEIVAFDERRENILPPGQPGELAVRSPAVFAGYYKDPEQTRNSFHPDGWFFTGDAAVIREDGNITFISRIKDIINRGGEKISPLEIEEHLYAHPKILNASVVGMPDPRLGERNCAYVVPRPGGTITLDEIVEFLLNRGLAKVKLPERLELMESLPMNASGKVLKNVLREDIALKIREGK